MPNEQNLIPNSERSPEELREMAANGGRASGVSRRRKRSLREAADLYLSLPVANKKAWNKISAEGVDPDDIEMLEDLVAAAINATVKQVDETAEAEMGKLTGGMNIPGL